MLLTRAVACNNMFTLAQNCGVGIDSVALIHPFSTGFSPHALIHARNFYLRRSVNLSAMPELETVSETIAALKSEGYTEDFNLKENCLVCRNDQYRIFHDEFVVDKAFRFEGPTDPADEAVVYAISSDKYNMKGVLVNGYGIYSDDIADEMLRKLEYHSHN
jgi:hypothetical protein